MYAPICWVIPPASDWVTCVFLIESSKEVLPWSTWPITVTTGGLGLRSLSLSSFKRPYSSSTDWSRFGASISISIPSSSASKIQVSSSILWFWFAITPRPISFVITVETDTPNWLAKSFTVIGAITIIESSPLSSSSTLCLDLTFFFGFFLVKSLLKELFLSSLLSLCLDLFFLFFLLLGVFSTSFSFWEFMSLFSFLLVLLSNFFSLCFSLLGLFFLLLSLFLSEFSFFKGDSFLEELFLYNFLTFSSSALSNVDMWFFTDISSSFNFNNNSLLVIPISFANACTLIFDKLNTS